jgi:hypothetical protein
VEGGLIRELTAFHDPRVFDGFVARDRADR